MILFCVYILHRIIFYCDSLLEIYHYRENFTFIFITFFQGVPLGCQAENRTLDLPCGRQAVKPWMEHLDNLLPLPKKTLNCWGREGLISEEKDSIFRFNALTILIS
jgi:hypothetical protein